MAGPGPAIGRATRLVMRNVGGQWKVFDVRISGISLVATYRSSFAEEVRNNGVDGLIGLLERKNRQI